jgi:4-aminobutyrate aminotransferase
VAREKMGMLRMGKRAKQLLKMDTRHISPSYTRGYPFFMDHGRGAYVWDVDGNRFLDFTSGIGVTSTGHSHPRVVEAIQRQAAKFLHMSGSDFYYESEITLAGELARITPGTRNKKVFFCNSGAEAVEAAIKLARYATRRPYILAFIGSFHGRTMGAMSLTSSKCIQRAHFGPLMPGVIHVPYADCARCSYGQTYGRCGIECVSYIEETLFSKNVDPDEVAAIFVEPILGEGGYIVPPPEFHRELARLASRYGILFVADEVQSGMGRTGKMFAIEHWNVVPDIVTIAKGVASGMPLGAAVAPETIMNWEPGTHGSTFGGNPVSCAAALATIKLLEESLIENASKMGRYLIGGLEKIARHSRHLGRISGKGLMIGMEIVKDRRTMAPDASVRKKIMQACFRSGLLILPCGAASLRFVPPLVIGREEADLALDMFDEAMQRIGKGRR